MNAQLPSSMSYFEEAYRDYEKQNPGRKLDHYVDQVTSLGPPHTRELLDIGCGLGSFLERVSLRKPEVSLFATDIRSDAVTASQARVANATVVEASAENIPFPSSSMDVITAWDVIEHVPDLDAVKSEILRLLRPGGAFLAVVPVYDGVTGRLVSWLDKDPTHLHKYSRDQWRQWAEADFRVISWHGLYRYLMGPIYLHWPSRTMRRISPAILMGCLKPD